jgi:hypothetical protein
VVLAEIAKRKAIQVPAVSGIAKRAEISVVGRNDNDATSRCEQAVKLFNRADYVGYVFDHVCGSDLTECTIAEWEREVIQVCDNIRPSMRVPIQAYSARLFIEPAPHIENWKLAYRTGRARGRLRFRGQRS